MRLIKGFLLTITGLFIIVTLISLLIPSQVRVERGVMINANAEKVFAEIRNLRHWSHWQPFLKTEGIKMNFSADSTGLNSFCEWEANGKKNKFIITAMRQNEITAVLVREGENDVVNTISVLPLSDSNTVQVGWKALTKLKWYPWEKFYGIFIEKITGQGYQDALNSLKEYAEQR